MKWLVTDHLGTPRMIFDQTGDLTVLDQNGHYVRGVTRHDYLPFGEELYAGTGGRTVAQGYTLSDNVRQKFTQKERDNETGLDYFLARYYSPTQGRFTSVDPENADAELDAPQSWNGYAYARNNPLLYTDPTGKGIKICGPDGNNCYDHENKDLGNLRKHCEATGDCQIVDDRSTRGRILNADGEVIATFANDLDGTFAGGVVTEMNRRAPVLATAVTVMGAAAVAQIAIPIIGLGSTATLTTITIRREAWRFVRASRPLNKMGHAKKHLENFRQHDPNLTEGDVAKIVEYVKRTGTRVGRGPAGEAEIEKAVEIGGKMINVRVNVATSGIPKSAYPK